MRHGYDRGGLFTGRSNLLHTHLATSLSFLNTCCPRRETEAPSIGQHAPCPTPGHLSSSLTSVPQLLCKSEPVAVTHMHLRTWNSLPLWSHHFLTFQLPISIHHEVLLWKWQVPGGRVEGLLSSEPQAPIHLASTVSSSLASWPDGLLGLKVVGVSRGEGVPVTRRGEPVVGR